MIILGCDPGLTGAIAAIQPGKGLLDVMDLPTCASGAETGRMQRWLDARALRNALIDWSVRFDFARESLHAVIEKPIPMPNLNASTIAAQFDTFGAVRAVLERLGAIEIVTPQQWKKLYGLKKGSGRDADRVVKEEACALARSLYSGAPITLAKHHNRAEAVLIGHWGVRKLHG